MSIETVLALFTLCFVIKATPGSGVFATVGRALFQGFGPTLVFIASIMTGDLLYLVFALAGLAVVVLAVGLGRLPIVPLGIVFSWGAYAYFKKQLPIGPNQGFLLEVLADWAARHKDAI